MALRNPSNLYGGGAVVFDSSPYTNFAIQMIQKRQAKQEAMDQYFQEVAAKVDGKGIRTQEQPALLGLKDDYQKFYLQNRQAILNPSVDGGKAQAELRQKVAQMNSLVNESALMQKQWQQFNDASLKNKDYTWDDGTMQQLQGFSQPRYIHDPATGQLVANPDWKDLDIANIHSVKNLSNQEMEAEAKGVLGRFANKQIVTPGQKPVPNDPESYYPTKTTSYEKETLNDMATAFKDVYNNSRNVRHTFNTGHELMGIKDEKDFQERWQKGHAAEFEKYNTLYKSITGNDIHDGASLYAATQLVAAATPSTEVATTPVANRAVSRQKDFEYDVRLENHRQANRKEIERTKLLNREAFTDYKNAKDEKSGTTILNKYISDLYNASKAPPVEISVDNGAQKISGRVITLDNSEKAAFGRANVDGTIRPPDYFILTHDKKYVVPVFNVKDRNGKDAGVTVHKVGNQVTTKTNTETKSSELIPLSTFKAKLANKWKGIKTVNELNDDYDEPTGDTPAATTSTKEKLDW